MTTIRSLAALILLVLVTSASATPWDQYMYCFRETIFRNRAGGHNETVVVAPKVVENCIKVAPPAGTSPEPVRESPVPPRREVEMIDELSCAKIGQGIDLLNRSVEEMRQKIIAITNEMQTENEALAGTYMAIDSLNSSCTVENGNCTDDELAYSAALRARIAATKSRCAGRPDTRDACMERVAADAERHSSVAGPKGEMERTCAVAEDTCKQHRDLIGVGQRLSSHLQALGSQHRQLVISHVKANRQLRRYQAEQDSRCSQR